jgi:hypothetical protein
MRIPHTAASHQSRVLALAVAVPLLVALPAGCGSSGSPSASNAASREQSSEAQTEAKFAQFAKCLREHGLNAEVVNRGGGAHGLKVGGNASGPVAMEGAQKACARYRPQDGPKRPVSPQQKVELEERVQKFAKCMREHGIKVEASTSGGGVQISVHAHPGSGEPNPESPGFQQAQSACQKLLPGGGPNGPGPSTKAGP